MKRGISCTRAQKDGAVNQQPLERPDGLGLLPVCWFGHFLVLTAFATLFCGCGAPRASKIRDFSVSEEITLNDSADGVLPVVEEVGKSLGYQVNMRMKQVVGFEWDAPFLSPMTVSYLRTAHVIVMHDPKEQKLHLMMTVVGDFGEGTEADVQAAIANFKGRLEEKLPVRRQIPSVADSKQPNQESAVSSSTVDANKGGAEPKSQHVAPSFETTWLARIRSLPEGAEVYLLEEGKTGRLLGKTPLDVPIWTDRIEGKPGQGGKRRLTFHLPVLRLKDGFYRGFIIKSGGIEVDRYASYAEALADRQPSQGRPLDLGAGLAYDLRQGKGILFDEGTLAMDETVPASYANKPPSPRIRDITVDFKDETTRKAAEKAAGKKIEAAPANEVALKPMRQPDVIYVPTPQGVVDKMLELAEVKLGDVVYDLGCGNGRIVVTAAKKYGVKAVGFDINPVRVKESLENVKANHVEDLVTIKEEDIFTLDLSEASVITLYLLPSLNVKLMPQLAKCKPGTRIVSHDFDMRGANPVLVYRMTLNDDNSVENTNYGPDHTIYKWVVPWKEADRTDNAAAKPEHSGARAFREGLAPVAPDQTPRTGGGAASKRARAPGETLLILAVERGDTKAIKSLLERGADANLMDAVGETPLTKASFLGQTEVVKLLWGKDAE